VAWPLTCIENRRLSRNRLFRFREAALLFSFCHFIDKSLGLAYVGTLTSDAEIKSKRGVETAGEFAKRLKDEHTQAIEKGSIPFWRRTAQAQSLLNLAIFISAGLAQGQTIREIVRPFMKAICY